MIAIDHYHDACLGKLPLLSALASACHVLLSETRSYSWDLGILLRLHPRQRHNTIHHILERLLVLFGRVSRGLRTLNFLSVVPLNLECRQDDTRVEAVDVLVGVCRQAF